MSQIIQGNVKKMCLKSPHSTYSLYNFQPLTFTRLSKGDLPGPVQYFTELTRLICTDNAIFVFGKLEYLSKRALRHRLIAKSLVYNMDASRWFSVIHENIHPSILENGLFVLAGNIIFVFSSNHPAIPFEWKSLVYYADLTHQEKDMCLDFRCFRVEGILPEQIWSHSATVYGKYIYTVHYTHDGNDNIITCFRFDIEDRKWEDFYKTKINGTSRVCIKFQLFLHNDRLFLMFSFFDFVIKTYDNIYLFEFDYDAMEMTLVYPLIEETTNLKSIPKFKGEYSCVQDPLQPNFLYLCSGFKDFYLRTPDVWQINLDTMVCQRITGFSVPRCVYFNSNSTALTPSGRLICYGFHMNSHVSTTPSDPHPEFINSFNSIHSSWIKVISLKEMALEALIFYRREGVLNYPPEYVRQCGIISDRYEKVDRLLNNPKYKANRVNDIPYIFQNTILNL